MLREREAFVPSLLRDPVFQSTGLRSGSQTGDGMRLHWIAIDPNRHAMYVWRKRGMSYPAAASTLSASAFSSGPFSDYPAGTFLRSTVRLAGTVLRTGPPSGHAGWPARLENLLVEHYQARVPLGWVVSDRDGIRERSVSRERLHYFGRGPGTGFADYRIEQGLPDGMSEAIGGLFRAVRSYRPYTVNQNIRVGYWGLCPFDDDHLRRAGIDEALACFEGHGAGPAPGGMILCVAGWANTQKLTKLLSTVRVRDAIQIDGGDSLMLGSGSRFHIGRWMPPPKRLLQSWGFQFSPLTPAAL